MIRSRIAIAIPLCPVCGAELARGGLAVLVDGPLRDPQRLRLICAAELPAAIHDSTCALARRQRFFLSGRCRAGSTMRSNAYSAIR
jgi:hypothetical protein